MTVIRRVVVAEENPAATVGASPLRAVRALPLADYADRLVSTEDIRRIALALPRTTEHLIRDRVKFRVGSLVYVALSRDETTMGFAFPKEERDALVTGDPAKFLPPEPADVRYHWVRARLAALDPDELHELVVDAWRMVVPKGVARAYDEAH